MRLSRVVVRGVAGSELDKQPDRQLSDDKEGVRIDVPDMAPLEAEAMVAGSGMDHDEIGDEGSSGSCCVTGGVKEITGVLTGEGGASGDEAVTGAGRGVRAPLSVRVFSSPFGQEETKLSASGDGGRG